MKYTQRLKNKYDSNVVPQLIKEFGIKNNMDVPKIVKIVVNSGVGEAVKNKEVLDRVKEDLAIITGQLPSVKAARVSVASFGVRKGMPVGVKVTLRGERMYSFFDKLVSIVLPRLRDFRGVSLDSFDKSGNYTLGIREHNVFPEIDISKSGTRGLELTIVTNTKDRQKSKRLLELLGMPFEKGE
jgi:large subunit ribosomal protein L5